MKLEKKAKEGEVLVWALETLGDGTVISGDSCGRVQASQLKFSLPELFGFVCHLRCLFSRSTAEFLVIVFDLCRQLKHTPLHSGVHHDTEGW